MKKIIAFLKKGYVFFGKASCAPIKRHSDIKFYRQFIGKSRLFFDIGANIGEKTKIFYKAGARVVAVEPTQYCFNILKNKFKNNKNITVVKKGVGAKSSVAEIYICSKSNLISSFSNKWQSGRFSKFNFDKKEKVDIITLDNLIKKFGNPDFCKIDVEGYELEVLRGLHIKIPVICFEYVSEFFDNAIKCLDMLENIGYKLFNYTVGENNKMKQWRSKADIVVEINQLIDCKNDAWGDIYAK